MQQLNQPNGNCKFEERQPWKQWPFSGLQTVINVKVVCDITFIMYLLCCRDWKVVLFMWTPVSWYYWYPHDSKLSQ